MIYRALKQEPRINPSKAFILPFTLTMPHWAKSLSGVSNSASLTVPIQGIKVFHYIAELYINTHTCFDCLMRPTQVMPCACQGYVNRVSYMLKPSETGCSHLDCGVNQKQFGQQIFRSSRSLSLTTYIKSNTTLLSYYIQAPQMEVIWTKI